MVVPKNNLNLMTLAFTQMQPGKISDEEICRLNGNSSVVLSDRPLEAIARQFFRENGFSALDESHELSSLFMRCTPRSLCSFLTVMARGILGKPFQDLFPLLLGEEGPLNERQTRLFEGVQALSKEADVRFPKKLMFDLMMGKSPYKIEEELESDRKKDFKLKKCLFFAAKYGQVEALRVLHELGANLDVGDNFGRAPAHYAAEEGKAKALRVLHELGANLNVGDDFGRTPAHRAVEKGQAEALRVLYELGTNLNVGDDLGKTPVHYAAEKGQAEALRVLYELGANLNVSDILGRTPAHCAAEMEQDEVLRVLDEIKTDIFKSCVKKIALVSAIVIGGIEVFSSSPSLRKVSRIFGLSGLFYGALFLSLKRTQVGQNLFSWLFLRPT